MDKELMKMLTETDPELLESLLDEENVYDRIDGCFEKKWEHLDLCDGLQGEINSEVEKLYKSESKHIL